MITIKLVGGLGNQLFQYSVGRSLAIKNNTELKLDISWYKNIDKNYRRYELENFNVDAKIATESEILGVGRIIKEKNFNFNKEILDIGDDIYLDGYWQSEKYFLENKNILGHELTLKKFTSPDAEEIAHTIKSKTSVSIHIRHGDYLLPKHKQRFNILPAKYYIEAMKIITEKTPDATFFIFSDDIEWSKTLPFPESTIFIDSKYKLQDHEQFALMSLCKHNIIANSSYSWWAGWLNKNENKVIIAPKMYYNDTSINVSDWAPESWIKI